MFLRKLSLVTLILLGIWARCNATELSCEKPYTEKVFSVKLKLPAKWRDLSSIDRADWSEKVTERLFSQLSFEACPSKHPVGEQGLDLLAGRSDGRGLVEAVVNETKYRAASATPNFSQIKCAKCDGGSEDCTQMSWKWVGNAVGYIGARECKKGGCYTLCHSIQNRIQKKGIEDALVRTANVVNDDGTCTFYAVYSDDTEKDQSRNLLMRLGKALRVLK